MWVSTESQEQLLRDVWQDFRDAEEAKRPIEERIKYAKLLIAGDTGTIHKITEGRSKVVVKDCLRQTLWAQSQLSRPFLTEKKLVSVTATAANSRINTEAIEELLNYQLYKKIGYRKVIKESLQSYINEGVIVSKIGWNLKTKKNVIGTANVRDAKEYAILVEKIAADNNEVLSSKTVTDEENGTYIKVSYGTHTIIKENPQITQVPFERFFPSPNATYINGVDYDADFVIEKNTMTLSEFKKKAKSNNWKNTDKLIQRYKDAVTSTRGKTEVSNTGEEEKSSLEIFRDNLLEKTSSTSTSSSRLRIAVYTEYGMFDPKNNGEDVMCQIVWAGDVLLYAEQSDYPDDSLPYIVCAFDKQNFSLYGTLFTEYVEDSQKIRTALMRTYIDNIAYGNYGIGLVEKGAIDAPNLERIRQRDIGDVVEVDGLPDAVYKELTAQAIPAQHIGMFDLWASEAETTTGFTKASQGGSANSGDSASKLSLEIRTGSYRINEYTDWYATEYWKVALRMFLLLDQEFLSPTTFESILGGENVSIEKGAINMDVEIDVKINTSGENDQKLNKLQQVFNLSEMLVSNKIVEPFIMKKIFMDMLNYLDMQEIAAQLKDTIEVMPNGAKSVFEILVNNGVPEEEAAAMAEKMVAPIVEDAKAIGDKIAEQKEQQAAVQKTLQRMNEEAQLEAYAEKDKNKNNVSQVGKFTPDSQISSMVTDAKATQAGITGGMNGAETI